MWHSVVRHRNNEYMLFPRGSQAVVLVVLVARLFFQFEMSFIVRRVWMRIDFV